MRMARDKGMRNRTLNEMREGGGEGLKWGLFFLENGWEDETGEQEQDLESTEAGSRFKKWPRINLGQDKNKETVNGKGSGRRTRK